MRHLIQLFILLLPIFSNGQDAELSMFDKLVDKTWKAEGTWGDGSKFLQEIEFKFSLDSSIVIAESTGFIDPENLKIGHRNHGIRQYDKETNTIKFWEFDVFGGLTEGVVFSEGKNIVYQYEYGESLITDMWVYVDEGTYTFIVGAYKNGEWLEKYLTTYFINTTKS